MTQPRILIVEGDIILARTYERFFRGLKYKVDIARSAQLAIDLMDQNRPEVILLETQLVEHNGYEFLYEMRSYSEWRDMPVIINSCIPSQDSNLDQARMDVLGIRSYLYKPTTSLRKLGNIIEKELSVTSGIR
jgi:DNA-binding response OmpR family regulator